MSTVTKKLNLIGHPKKDWSYKKEPRRYLSPIKDNLLLIFMNPSFNLFIVSYIEHFVVFSMGDSLVDKYPIMVVLIEHFVVFFHGGFTC
jgi:hypothetical protein